MDTIFIEHTQLLSEKLNSVLGNVSCSLTVPADKPTHSFVPGDTVLVKTLNPRKVSEAAYGPPTTVISVTRTAVLMTSSSQWIHPLVPLFSGPIEPLNESLRLWVIGGGSNALYP
uniref:Uncharacterized protein n=1 Tax=Pygocentrus nattereri TaxID=42514 RepID=A0A3B4CEH5_PYGNA